MPFLLGQPQLLFLEELQPLINIVAIINNIHKALWAVFIKLDCKLNYFHKYCASFV